MLPRKRSHALFADQESSEKKGKDDSDIQGALQSHLWQGVEMSRELAVQKASGRKKAKLTVYPGWNSASWEEAPESQKGEPEAMSNSGSYQQWRKRDVLPVARRQREDAENKLKKLVGSRIKPGNRDIKAIHACMHASIHSSTH